jgi:hypothetical protein
MLVITYVQQNAVALRIELYDDFALSVRASYRRAFSLATTYRHLCGPSRLLYKRLTLMRESLYRLGVLSRESDGHGGDGMTPGTIATAMATGTAMARTPMSRPQRVWGVETSSYDMQFPAIGSTGGDVRRYGSHGGVPGPSPTMYHHPGPGSGSGSGSGSGMASTTPGADMMTAGAMGATGGDGGGGGIGVNGLGTSMTSGDMLMYDWLMGDAGTFLSEGRF